MPLLPTFGWAFSEMDMDKKCTSKEEQFCLKYVESGGRLADSYMSVYTWTGSKNGLTTAASRLLKRPHVEARIAELRAKVVEKCQITLEQHLDDLKRLRDKAEQDQKWQAAISAEVNRGRACGLYVEKVEHENVPTPQIVINRPSDAN